MAPIEFIPVLSLAKPCQENDPILWESEPVYATNDAEAKHILEQRIAGLPEIRFKSWASISLADEG